MHSGILLVVLSTNALSTISSWSIVAQGRADEQMQKLKRHH